MSHLFKVLVAALAAATLGAAQLQTCEDKCASKQLAAIKCETMECYCFAYDDPDYVSCLQSECGKGYACEFSLPRLESIADPCAKPSAKSK
jgi:hypothetical protein